MTLFKGILFSTNHKEHYRIWHKLLSYSNKPFIAEIYYYLVKYIFENTYQYDSWCIDHLEESAALGYKPSIKLLAEIKAKDESVTSEPLAPFSKRFSAEELFSETDLFTIDASNEEGFVRLVFKSESEEAYSNVLDFLNNLLRKRYAQHFEGYQLLIKFVEEPLFSIPSFPKTPVNAFFGKAITYPNLHAKIEEYAKLAFAKGGQYLEINSSEVNTIVGAFAAGALSIANIKYLYLIDEYIPHVDSEHECVQRELIHELEKAHGITQEMVPTIFDLATSFYQPGYYGVSEAMYINPQNLKVIAKHTFESPIYERSRNTALVNFVENHLLYKTPKNNLRKIAELANRADNETDKQIYIKFYNLYKNLAEQYHKEDYGEDLGAGKRAYKLYTDYTEITPVCTNKFDAIKKGCTIEEDNDYSSFENTFIYFHPLCFRDPKIKLLIDRQWNKATNNKYVDTVSFSDKYIVYEDWYIDFGKMPCNYGIIHLKSDQKPIIYYGGLDTVALANVAATKEPKDEKARLKIQDKYSVMDVPSLITDKDERREKLLGNLFEALYNYSNYQIQRIAELVTPEDGDYYFTALMYGIDVALQKGDKKKAKNYCESLAKAEPLYSDFWLKEANKYK